MSIYCYCIIAIFYSIFFALLLIKNKIETSREPLNTEYYVLFNYNKEYYMLIDKETGNCILPRIEIEKKNSKIKYEDIENELIKQKWFNNQLDKDDLKGCKYSREKIKIEQSKKYKRAFILALSSSAKDKMGDNIKTYSKGSNCVLEDKQLILNKIKSTYSFLKKVFIFCLTCILLLVLLTFISGMKPNYELNTKNIDTWSLLIAFLFFVFNLIYEKLFVQKKRENVYLEAAVYFVPIPLSILLGMVLEPFVNTVFNSTSFMSLLAVFLGLFNYLPILKKQKNKYF